MKPKIVKYEGMFEMTEIKFYESIADELLKFAVIFAKTQNKYVFCKHKDRDTWEVPGGHRGKYNGYGKTGTV